MAKKIEEKYQELSEIQHILNRPGMWVGSTNSEEKDSFIYNAKTGKFEMKITNYIPAMLKVVDEVISKHIEGNYDYTTNTLVRTYPDGLDCEVFTVATLKDMWMKAKLKSEREHVTLYIKNNKNEYNLGNIEYSEDLSDLRWTVDEKEDFILISQIYESLYDDNELFLMEDILNLFENNPDLLKINEMYERNEGLMKSLENDEIIR
jgi:spore coat polysaccharide biosynthesis protein SpsF